MSNLILGKHTKMITKNYLALNHPTMFKGKFVILLNRNTDGEIVDNIYQEAAASGLSFQFANMVHMTPLNTWIDNPYSLCILFEKLEDINMFKLMHIDKNLDWFDLDFSLE